MIINARNDNLDQAQAHIQSISEIDPKSHFIDRARAALHLSGGRHNEAMTAIEAAIKRAPDVRGLYAIRGAIKVRTNGCEAAIADYDRALDNDGDAPSDRVFPPARYHLHRGYCWHVLKKYEDAITDYNKYVELYPGDQAGAGWRSITYVFNGEFDKALADLERVTLPEAKPPGYVMTGLRAHDSLYFGPARENYENGVYYTLTTMQRVTEKVTPVNDVGVAGRREQLFAKSRFNKPEMLVALEMGLLPVGAKEFKPDQIAFATMYFGKLINVMNQLNDPFCNAAIKNLDDFVAQLAYASNFFSTFARAVQQDGVNFFAALLGGVLINAVVEEQATEDAVMLVGLHGCDSEVVLDILRHGSKLIHWSGDIAKLKRGD